MLKSLSFTLFIDLELLILLQKQEPRMAIKYILKILIILAFLFNQLDSYAQSHSFVGRFVNKEYNIYIEIDLYTNKIIVPNQEIFGEMAGYLGDYKDGRKWLITNSKINSNDNVAELVLVNDYGSEDLKAEFIKNDNNSYLLKQVKGSTLKIARNRKWIKLPKTLAFIIDTRKRN